MLATKSDNQQADRKTARHGMDVRKQDTCARGVRVRFALVVM